MTFFLSSHLFVGLLSARCRLLVTDVRVECRYKHEGLVEQLVDTLAIWLDARDTVIREGHAGVAEQPC